MTIKKKLSLLLIFICISILTFATLLIIPKWQLANELNHLESFAKLSGTVSELVHEIQKERGLSSGFVTAKNDKFLAKINEQKKATDLKLKQYFQSIMEIQEESIFKNLKNTHSQTKLKLDTLPNFRQKVMQRSSNSEVVIKFYSEINKLLIQHIDMLVTLVSDAKISTQISTFSNFLKAKELSGVERALMTAVFTRDQFEKGEFYKLIELITSQNKYLEFATGQMTDLQKKSYKQIVKDQNYQKVEGYRNTAALKQTEGDFDIDSITWFKTITAKIENLKQFELLLSDDLLLSSVNTKNSAEASLLWFSMISLLIILTMVFAFYKILISIVKPIDKLVNIIQQIGQGRLDKKADIETSGEIALIQKSLNHLIEALDKKVKIAEKVADGDLTSEVMLASKDDLLGKALQTMSAGLTKLIIMIQDHVIQLSGSATQLSSTSGMMAQSADTTKSQMETVAATSDEIAVNISQVASSATEMSINIQSVAATSTQMSHNMKTISESVEVMSGSIQNVADKSKNASDIANNAAEISQHGVSVMNSLSNSAHEIGEVTEMIKEISQQTNLLALNANIEAASAGAAGKGFAVVANEIKDLAKQASGAAEEIGQKINSIQKDTSGAEDNMNQISEIIGTLKTSSIDITQFSEEQSNAVQEIHANLEESTIGVADVAKLIEELSLASNEGARNSSEIEIGIKEISKSVNQVNLSVKEMMHSVGEVHQSSESLSGVATQLNKTVQQFKTK